MKIIDSQGRVFLPRQVADIPSGNLVWVDAVNGVDALAVRGRMTIPFRTLTAAKNAAQPGNPSANPPVPNDTIIVLPGYYDEKNLLKDKVNWHFFPGAVVKYTGGGTGGIFDTSSYGTNGAASCSITGHGEFIVTGTDSTNHVIHASASGSFLTIQARSINSTSVPPVKLAQSSSGFCHVEVMEDITCGSGDVIVCNTSVQGNLVRARDLYTSGGRCVYVSTGSGSLEVTARKMTASAAVAIDVQGGSGALVIRAYEVFSQSKQAVFYDTTGGLVLTILGARLVSQAAVAADGRAVYIGSNSSHKVKLANCVLIASSAAAESVYSSNSGINVHLLAASVGNKDRHTNLTFIPSTNWAFNSNFS